jgi:predicted ATPase
MTEDRLLPLMRVTVTNFKTVQNLDLELKRLNVLIGANASVNQILYLYSHLYHTFYKVNFSLCILDRLAMQNVS